MRPWQLMAGKVLGIGLVGLGQVALVVLAGVGTALGLGLVDTSTIDLGTAAAWALVWFVVGFVSYALLMAGLGALVSRQEDVGAVTTPVTFLMIVPYIVGVSVAPWAPDNPLVVWLSYVPLCSPLLMPVRIALGSAEPWEALVALGLSVAVIPCSCGSRRRSTPTPSCAPAPACASRTPSARPDREGEPRSTEVEPRSPK